MQSDGEKRVVWDGRHTVRWMLDQGISNGPFQNEWQGFYWEARARALLNDAFSPNPEPRRVKFGSATFDYALNYVWDMKAHTQSWRNPVTGKRRSGQAEAPLNDRDAMDECIHEQGLGILMLSGEAIEDVDGGFVAWHRDLKAAHSVVTKPSNSGNSRARKAAFEPLHIQAVFFPTTDAFDGAKAAGQISGFHQGKQAPAQQGEEGRSRRPKYKLKVNKLDQGQSLVAEYSFPGVDGS